MDSGLASGAATVSLEAPGKVTIPDIPKDAFACSGQSVWVVVAVIELVIIGWLIYKLNRK